MGTVKRLGYWTFAFVATSFICFVQKTAPEPNNIAQYCRPGECPSIPIGKNCPNFWELQDDCYLDYQCPAGQKCCSDGCELRCMSTKSGKKIKFPEKNKTQVIEANNIFPLDLKAFYIGDSSFFSFTGWGPGYLHIYKWYNSSVGFKKYQMFKTNAGRTWEPFTIGGDQYFVFGQKQGIDKRLYVYKWDKEKKIFVKSSILSKYENLWDLDSFNLDGRQHIAVAQGSYGLFMIFRWNGTSFNIIQKTDLVANYIKAFKLNGIIYVGASDGRGKTVALYKWNGSKFTLAQGIKTNHGTYGIDALTVGDQSFIAVAAIQEVLLFKWNGKEFKEFQQIRSRTAYRISVISSPIMGEEYTYLAVNNLDDVPVIYIFDRESGQFKKHQGIKIRRAGDIKFIEMSGNLYLIVTTKNRVHVYKGVAV